MFSELLLDHFRHPRNAGELPGATVRVEVTNPVCGDVLRLAARIEDGRFAEVRFLCRGCTSAIACASLLTETITGRPVKDCGATSPEQLSQALGGLPDASSHAAQLASDALQELLGKLA